MRTSSRFVLISVALLVAMPACAQDPTPSDARVRQLSREAKERQIRYDQITSDRWFRWTYAVCIGCNPLPAHYPRIVTNPLRVLAGIPAYIDDGPVNQRFRPIVPG